MDNCGSAVSSLTTNTARCVVEAAWSRRGSSCWPEGLRGGLLRAERPFVVPVFGWGLFFESLNSLVGKVWKHSPAEFISEPAMPSVCTGGN